MSSDRALREAGARIIARHAETDPPSSKQAELLDKMLRSHVFTDDERARITRKAATGRAVMAKAIDYVTEQIKDRKAAEKAAKENAV